MLESVDKDVIRKGAKGKVGWISSQGLWFMARPGVLGAQCSRELRFRGSIDNGSAEGGSLVHCMAWSCTDGLHSNFCMSTECNVIGYGVRLYVTRMTCSRCLCTRSRTGHVA